MPIEKLTGWKLFFAAAGLFVLSWCLVWAAAWLTLRAVLWVETL